MGLKLENLSKNYHKDRNFFNVGFVIFGFILCSFFVNKMFHDDGGLHQFSVSEFNSKYYSEEFMEINRDLRHGALKYCYLNVLETQAAQNNCAAAVGGLKAAHLERVLGIVGLSFILEVFLVIFGFLVYVFWIIGKRRLAGIKSPQV